MLQAREVLAGGAELSLLHRAQLVLKSALEQKIIGAEWCIRGSVRLNEALRAELAGGLDVDCYLVLQRNQYQLSVLSTIEEVLRKLCERQQWMLASRQSGYRVTIRQSPPLTLDLSILLRHRFAVEWLHRCGGVIDATNVLESNSAFTPAMRDYFRYCAWLNLKLWAKTKLCWASRPSTYLLRSLATCGATFNGTIRLPSGWQRYVEWVRGVSARMESGESISRLKRTDKLPAYAEGLLEPFAAALRDYAEEIRYATPTEHENWLRSVRPIAPLRVFLSSRQREFSALRFRVALTSPQTMQFLLSEQFFPWTSRVNNGMAVCETMVDSADVFVGLYGREYGASSPNRPGSPIDEELKRARAVLPTDRIFLFSLLNVPAESRLVDFLRRNSDMPISPLFSNIDLAASQVISCVSDVGQRLAGQ